MSITDVVKNEKELCSIARQTTIPTCLRAAVWAGWHVTGLMMTDTHCNVVERQCSMTA